MRTTKPGNPLIDTRAGGRRAGRSRAGKTRWRRAAGCSPCRESAPAPCAASRRRPSRAPRRPRAAARTPRRHPVATASNAAKPVAPRVARREARPIVADVLARARGELAARASRAVERPRDVARVHVEHVVQEKRRALERRQPLERQQQRDRQIVAPSAPPARDHRLRQPGADVVLAPVARADFMRSRHSRDTTRARYARGCSIVARRPSRQRRNASCTTSSASATEPSMRYASPARNERCARNPSPRSRCLLDEITALVVTRRHNRDSPCLDDAAPPAIRCDS